MRTSVEGINLIKKYEGCNLTAYKCPAGVYTIGYGHTNGVKKGDVITQEQAEKFLEEDIKIFETALVAFVSPYYDLKQNEFDALISLVFNIGIKKFKNSTLLKKLIAKDRAGAAKQFDFWVYAKGIKLKGLCARRTAEKALFLKGCC